MKTGASSKPGSLSKRNFVGKEFATEKLSSAARVHLKSGMEHFNRADWLSAEAELRRAWLLAPKSFGIMVALSKTLTELGERPKAIELLEEALAIHGPNETLLAIMGEMAVNMSLHDVAEKVWRTVLSLNPSEPSYYVNLGAAQIAQEKYDDALAMLNDTVALFPSYPPLWNSLGVVAKAKQMFGEARAFFRQAISLDESDYRFWSNLASVESDRDTVLSFSNKALALNPDCTETHLGLANLHFEQGFVALAWPHWERRMSAERARGQNTQFAFDFPSWQGEDVSDKTLLVCGEQGIGDEVFFAKSLPKIYQQAKQLVLACEPRLVSVFKRLMPEAIVEAYETQTLYGHTYRKCSAIDRMVEEGSIEIDFFCPLASTWPYTWGPRRFDIPVDEGGYLHSDPALKAKWQQRLGQLPGSLKIGVSWESSNKANDRVGGYTDVSFWRDIAALEGVDLICLQYGDVGSQLKEFHAATGRRIHSWDDVDLKQDIEANLAIMDNLDFVVGPATATQMFSMALGPQTLLLARGRPWWHFGTSRDEERLFYAPNLRWIDNRIHQFAYGSKEREAFDFWQDAETQVRAIIHETLQKKAVAS